MLNTTATSSFDFVCGLGQVGVVVRSVSSCSAHLQQQQRLFSLLQELRSTPHPKCLVLVHDTVGELPLEWLSMTNEITLSLSWGLAFVSSFEEAARLLEGISQAQVSLMPFQQQQQQICGSGGMAEFTEAFTQPPQIVTRLDVVRIANKFGSVAKFLEQADEASLRQLPQLGGRGLKASRLMRILSAEFPSTEVGLKGAGAATERERHASSDSRNPAVAAALQRLREQEDHFNDDYVRDKIGRALRCINGVSL
jgi:DNA excision repair protein ERCC-1